MTDVELDDLERKAKAATQGEWKAPSQPEGMVDVWVEQTIDDDVARRWGHLRAITPEIRGRDAEHIAAANPRAVLALVAEVRRLRGIVRDLAAKKPPAYNGTCLLCHLADDDEREVNHTDSCPYRRALAWAKESG